MVELQYGDTPAAAFARYTTPVSYFHHLPVKPNFLCFAATATSEKASDPAPYPPNPTNGLAGTKQSTALYARRYTARPSAG